MISKLKEEAGEIYVIKMSGMINDFEKNKINIELYKPLGLQQENREIIKHNEKEIKTLKYEINKNNEQKEIISFKKKIEDLNEISIYFRKK